MHSFETTQSNVPAFLVKLWKLVEDTSCDDLIAWSDNGTSFIIRDQAKFAKELLPQYFKHNNMASFIRQLNMYGFRKVMNYERTSIRGESDEMEFMHSFFCKGQGSLLELIKRKIPNTKVAEPPIKSNAKDILTDLTSIKEKQETMDNMLLKMKQENELLWRELTSMRQKHKAQEQIIQKVIQFLISIVQRSNQNVGVQRNITRMLQDIPGKQANTKLTRSIDVLNKKKNCFITDKVVSPLGPVIHEVTEFDHESDFLNPPSAKSMDEKSDKGISEIEIESENPMNSSLNSPISTSLALEPLSILEPLQSSGIPTGDEACNSAGESVLGIPLEYINMPIEESPVDATSLPVENDNSGTISVSENNFEAVQSFSPNPQTVLFSPSPEKKDLEDIMFESLNTPQVPVIHIEDDAPVSNMNQDYKNFKKSPVKAQTSVKGNLLNGNQVQKSTGEVLAQNDHNYQLAVPANSSSLIRTPALTNVGKRCAPFSQYSERGYCTPVPLMDKRNTLSNHLLNVEEELNWLQDQIASNTWNIDANKLLGLFSSDDVANNESLIGDISVENIKSEPIDIVGNELVQFTPSMLEVELNADSNPFFDCLNQDAQVPIASDGTLEQKEILNVLNEPLDQMAASEAAEYFLGNKDTLKRNSPKRRSKCPKSNKNKRKKLK
ncbi:heat shock factor protein 1-like isoform X2 [Uloborus diversus]|uniref:heat shock factor protein 1-like isoform X2 n=1 Tax=Uloborus diversus TaxID=327109 RepID=UPI00240946F0|nr:heat shock factor protein 1-like isoform X2 [Uloborus diversus]